MTVPPEQTALFAAFKAILKARKISYGELAERTGASESTIKRIFSIEECSLSRLLELLAAVELGLSDLVAFAADRNVDVSQFSAAAEAFLADELDYFFVYRKLFHHRDVEDVRRREGLTRAQMTKYLKKLDDLGVIKWLPGDQVSFEHAEFLKFRDDGPLKTAVYKAWTPKFHRLVVDRMDDPRFGLRLFSARCSPSLRESFIAEFEDMVERFVRRADLDRKTQPDKLEPFAVSLASAPLRIGLDERDIDQQSN